MSSFFALFVEMALNGRQLLFGGNKEAKEPEFEVMEGIEVGVGTDRRT